MARNFKLHRRRLFGAAAAMIAAAELRMIEPAMAQASGTKQPDAADAAHHSAHSNRSTPARSILGTPSPAPPTDRRFCCCTAGPTTFTASPRSLHPGLSGISGHRSLSARLRNDGFFERDAEKRPTGSRRRRCDRAHGRAQNREGVLGGFDWGARTADIVAALWPERCKASFR